MIVKTTTPTPIRSFTKVKKCSMTPIREHIWLSKTLMETNSKDQIDMEAKREGIRALWKKALLKQISVSRKYHGCAMKG